MHTLSLECGSEEKDFLLAELWERGTVGVTEEESPNGRCLLRAFFDAPVADLPGEWREEPDRDWVEVSRSRWAPLPIGERFFLVPAWLPDPAPPGRLRLVTDSGLACGTGWHPATQLCLEAMERHLVAGTTVFDVGTGSGILSEAALLLGAGRVLACDIDPVAVETAARRLHGAGLFVGSARSVAAQSVDLLVANINAETIVSMAPEIARVTRGRGSVILSGFQQKSCERVRAALLSAGRPPIATMDKDGWAALVC